jgi:hypothetical protein
MGPGGKNTSGLGERSSLTIFLSSHYRSVRVALLCFTVPRAQCLTPVRAGEFEFELQASSFEFKVRRGAVPSRVLSDSEQCRFWISRLVLVLRPRPSKSEVVQLRVIALSTEVSICGLRHMNEK